MLLSQKMILASEVLKSDPKNNHIAMIGLILNYLIGLPLVVAFH